MDEIFVSKKIRLWRQRQGISGGGVYVLVPSPLFHCYATQLMISIQRANCARKGTPFLHNKEDKRRTHNIQKSKSEIGAPTIA